MNHLGHKWINRHFGRRLERVFEQVTPDKEGKLPPGVTPEHSLCIKVRGEITTAYTNAIRQQIGDQNTIFVLNNARYQPPHINRNEKLISSGVTVISQTTKRTRPQLSLMIDLLFPDLKSVSQKKRKLAS